MPFQYAMNIHVLDKNSVPVPGALVTVYANGKPKIRGKSRGYVNSPLKLRFNSEAARLRINVEYQGKVMADEEFMASTRDATIHLQEVEMPAPGSNEKFKHENWGAFVFGCLMLVLLFLSPMFLPNVLPPYLSGFYSKILLTMLALGAAGFAAALTGFILVELGKPDRGYLIRAGGALGVFVVVFFWNPAGM